MSKRKILGSFIIGAVLGSLVGLLTTPYSGKKMRARLIKKTKKLIGYQGKK